MKKVLKQIFFLSLLVTLFVSCEKDENKNLFLGGTAPTFSASVTGPLVLTIANRNNPAITFNWTNPDYQFTTGLSSLDVTYTLEIDSTGSNFTNPQKGQTVYSKVLSTNLTVGELNSKLLAAGFLEDMPHEIEFRIKANLINNSAIIYSNVIKMTITPFLDVLYPVPANLYITGSATPASWQCGCGEPELLSQKFTKINAFTFKLSVALSANNSYLLLPVYGSWSAKYGFTGGNNSNNVYADDFKPNGGDLKSPPVSGIYNITVNFKTGKFTVTQ